MSTTKPINEKAFTTMTEESAYWAGFLAADGNVSGNRVRLYLGAIDIDHLIKFKEFLKSEHTIGESEKFNRCSLEFANKHIRADLENLFNITPRKSLTLKFPSIPMYLVNHFLRGYFDGDGTICETFSSKASITASLITAFLGAPDFMEVASEICHTCIDKPNTLKLRVHPNGMNKVLKFNTLDSIRFLNWLYSESTPNTRLTRKYEIYDRVVLNGVRLTRVMV